MKTIEKAGHIYCFRLKKNIKCFIYDKKEDHKIWKWLDELTTYEWHSALYDDVLFTFLPPNISFSIVISFLILISLLIYYEIIQV